MPTPILIDTDMGVDDAVAIALALASGDLEVAGLASVGGNVSLDQATVNIGRLLAGLGNETWPLIGRGLDQAQVGLRDASHVFGEDGLGRCTLPPPGRLETLDYLDLYERCIETHGRELVILAIGPLTNLAAVLRHRSGLLRRAGRIVVMGGAVWCKGNVTPHAEFNFYRDPGAAAAVLAAGLPVTVVPLDVTRQVALDESHVAQLSRAGTRAGDLLAEMIRFPLEAEGDAAHGSFLVHDALALGAVIWPPLFMRAQMALEVVVAGEQAGRSKPLVAKDKSRQIGVVMSVKGVDFVENMLERLCHQGFVV